MNEWVKRYTWEHITIKKAAEHLTSSYLWLVSEKKTEAVNAYLIKNSKGEGEKKKGGGGLGGGVLWVYKMGLKWPVTVMAITQKAQSVSLSLPALS